MNKVFLKGNVGQEPEIHTFDDGGKAARFTLATTERGYTTKSGKEVEEKTYWHNVIIKRSGLAGVVEKYVHKGTPVLVSGSYIYREYEDKDGKTKRVYEVLADEMELCGGKKEQNDDLPPDDEDKVPSWLK